MITIKKAIEILSYLNNYLTPYPDQHHLDALKLGIEALKRHLNKASFTYAGLLQPLPGETKEK